MDARRQKNKKMLLGNIEKVNIWILSVQTVTIDMGWLMIREDKRVIFQLEGEHNRIIVIQGVHTS